MKSNVVPGYTQFRTKLSVLLRFAKSSQIQKNFKLSLKPKLLVSCIVRSFIFSIKVHLSGCQGLIYHIQF